MAFEGMDPVVVKDISVKLNAQAKAVASVLTIVQGQVDRARTAWQGPAASTFESGWNSQHKPSLVNAHDQLSTMSALLNSQATAQTVTSDEISGPGGGSGALPLGTAAGGTGGTVTPGSSGAGDPAGKKEEDDPLAWVDTLGRGIAIVGLPFAAAEVNALRIFGTAANDLHSGVLTVSAARAAATTEMYKLVNAGVMTQSQVAGELSKLDSLSKPAMDVLTKNLTNATKFAGEQGGLGATKIADVLGKGAGVLAVLGDGLTLWRPGATGTQGLENRLAAGGNLVGTAGAFAGTVAPLLGVDASLFAANASLDWVPVAGQVLAVGTAAYLAYEQVPFIHNGVNAAFKGVVHGEQWLGNEEIKGAKAVPHTAANVTGDVIDGGKSVVNSVAHAGSSVLHAGGSVIHSISNFL